MMQTSFATAGVGTEVVDMTVVMMSVYMLADYIEAVEQKGATKIGNKKKTSKLLKTVNWE